MKCLSIFFLLIKPYMAIAQNKTTTILR